MISLEEQQVGRNTEGVSFWDNSWTWCRGYGAEEGLGLEQEKSLLPKFTEHSA